MPKIPVILFIMILFSNVLFAQVDVQKILETVDQIQTLNSDATAKVDIIQKSTDQGTKKLEMLWYKKDSIDGMLIAMLNPSVERGNGYLKVGKNMWMYRKNTRTFQHVGRDESIGGTEAQMGDFERSNYADLYEAEKDEKGKEKISEDQLGKISAYKIYLQAVVTDVDYPKQIIWVRKDNNLPLKIQGFSLSGNLMQTTYLLKYIKVKEKYVVTKGLVIDEFEKGNKAVWEVSNISFNPIAKKIFTKAYLENLSK
ncbi:outer membrane lipoprotein-sorting protein [Candidatus Margulisiibacteriota bacterium]